MIVALVLIVSIKNFFREYVFLCVTSRDDRGSNPVEKTADIILHGINNGYYDSGGDTWWQPDSLLHLIHSSVNPARIGYFKRVLLAGQRMDPAGKQALEVGCGGGFLCEEIARMGFGVTGVDPSLNSIEAAKNHAKSSGLDIRYESGTGEALPYDDNTFNFVFCCDVLEHVSSVQKVISEISRVLIPGGTFFYDTFNRTLFSKLVAINIAQVWKRWAFAPPGLHVWEMFLKPEELKKMLASNSLKWCGHTGLMPNAPFPALLHKLRTRARGFITYRELGQTLSLTESRNTLLMYMGYAVKRPT
jgi:2-polyprenyl-6-hydroxyphenyl methylase/3-demethylubiquinone-9 3-methyltransferase